MVDIDIQNDAKTAHVFLFFLSLFLSLFVEQRTLPLSPGVMGAIMYTF